MGNFISEAWDDLTGKSGADAARDAAKVQSKASLAALEELKRQYGIQSEALQPFVDLGPGAAEYMAGTSTGSGLAETIARIMSGEDFAPLMDERKRAIQGMLGAGGLTRSGAAITEGARLPTDLAFEIENLLYGRNLNAANMATSAAVQQGSSAGPLYNASLVPSQARAMGILGGAQAQAAGTQNMMNLLGKGALAYMTGGGF